MKNWTATCTCMVSVDNVVIILLWYVLLSTVNVFLFVHQEKDDNQKAKADRKLLAEDIVDLLMSVVTCLQVGKESIRRR